MRAFVALELPIEFEDSLAAIARQLGRCVPGRFMDRQTYHVTLAFLGEVDDAQALRAADAVQRACAEAAPVPLTSDGLGKFGKPADATLWLGLRPAPALLGLARRVREELDAAGVAYDEKPFKAHVTLARRARVSGKQALPALEFPAPAWAPRVTLFKSMLDSEGATYKALHSFELPQGTEPPPDPLMSGLAMPRSHEPLAMTGVPAAQAAPESHRQKGIGPNKASGHKGGISRQGSKRG